MNFMDILNSHFELVKPEKGQLLISEPFLEDPSFQRSVVLLTAHNKEGSMGFVLNHKSAMFTKEVIPELNSPSTPLYNGGPVGKDHVYYMHSLGEVIEESIQIKPGLWWGGSFEQLNFYLKTKQLKPNQVRFFLGYSGWSPNQLQQEIDEKSWIVAPGNPKEIMSDNPNYWKSTLEKLGRDFKIMASFPKNPNLN